MRTHLEIDQAYNRQALKAARTLTPGHAAAEAAVEAADEDELARRRREHVQHEVDPYLHEAPEVASFDVGKMYAQALEMRGNPCGDAFEVPTDYPRPIAARPEAFRKGPIREGHDAVSPGYEPPLRFSAPPEPTTCALPRTPSPGAYVEEWR